MVEVGCKPMLQECRARTQHWSLQLGQHVHYIVLFCSCNHVSDNCELSHCHWSFFSFGKETPTQWPFDLDLIAPFSNPGVFKQLSCLLSLGAFSSDKLLTEDKNEVSLSEADREGSLPWVVGALSGEEGKGRRLPHIQLRMITAET